MKERKYSIPTNANNKIELRTYLEILGTNTKFSTERVSGSDD